jgi:hypothetical protein
MLLVVAAAGGEDDEDGGGGGVWGDPDARGAAVVPPILSNFLLKKWISSLYIQLIPNYKINSSFSLFAKVAFQIFTTLGPASWVMGKFNP